ncbi:MAG: hypothetical protein FJ194_07405 [Gammaproteobacteria bacterium]|nr:hypothetical protein [Gammaproteobacteria bacterium]
MRILHFGKFFSLVIVLKLFACQSMMVGPPSGPMLAAETLQVSPRVVLAGKLNDSAMPALKAANALVIDLRHTPEGADDEARLMATNGITWINLPQGRETPMARDVQYLDDILNAWPGRNVVVHCATGNRAGKLWASWRMSRGETLEAPTAEVAPIVTMPAIKAAIDAPGSVQ